MSIYIAHVITEAVGLGDPEVVVTTDTDEVGAADLLASYPLPPGRSPSEVLTEHGWRVLGLATAEPYIYEIYEVEPSDWVGLVRAVTSAREAARAELRRQDTAWRRVISDAMRVPAGVARQALASAAGVTVARLYQIRDGRR